MSEQLKQLKIHIEGCAESMNRGIQAARAAGMNVVIESTDDGVAVRVDDGIANHTPRKAWK